MIPQNIADLLKELRNVEAIAVNRTIGSRCLSQLLVREGLVPELNDALREYFELVNTPELEDFFKAVPLEVSHQRQRWGREHDQEKGPADWFWLIGYVAGKALAAVLTGNVTKAKHHVITTAAVCANWHAAILRSQK